MPKTPRPTPAGTIASRAAAKRRAQPAETTSTPRQRRTLAEMVRNPVGLTATQHAKNVAHAATHLSNAELRDLSRVAVSEAVRITAATVLKERGGVVGNGKQLAGAGPSKGRADKAIAKAVKKAAAAKDPDEKAARTLAAGQAAERLSAERRVRHLEGYGPIEMTAESWAR